MNLDVFKQSLTGSEAPAVSGPLHALWVEARGDWDAAHRIVQELDDATAAWVHAYLHRKEGDASNAGYWYRRAAKPVSSQSLNAEWDEIATSLLEEN